MFSSDGWRVACAQRFIGLLVASAPVFFPLASPHAASAQALYAEAPGPIQHGLAIERGRALAKALLQESGAPGLSVAVAVRGKLVWAEGFGYADLENRVPVTPLTKFRIGSVSKPLSMTALALLHDQGKLDLNAPIQTYVPYFPVKQWPVTVRQVAGHIGGVRSYNYADYDDTRNEFVSARRFATVKESLDVFGRDPLVHEPGTKYLYSSNGFNLLSAAVETASGTDFLTYMKQNVFEPLGLMSTVADHTDSIIPYRTRFYMRMKDGRLLNGHYADLSNKWAGGGFLSTPSDLVRWGSAYLTPGLLKPQTIQDLWTSQRTTDGKETGYGMGWMIGTDMNGHRTVSHGGGSIGGTTAFVIYPEQGVVIAMTINSSVSPMNNISSATIAEAFLAPPTPARIAGNTASGVDPAGSYRYTVQAGNGTRQEGTLQIIGAPGTYRALIVPDSTPDRQNRSQDGSFALRLTNQIPVGMVTVNGQEMRLIGADPGGFTNLWITVDGQGFSGRWLGRGVDGNVRGVKERRTISMN